MPLTNSQYDSIMRGYSRTRMANLREADLRRERICSVCPGLEDLLKNIQAGSAELARFRLQGQSDDARAMKADLDRLRKQRDELLREHGYSTADLEPRYTCPDCRDTGYIGAKKCHCFRQTAIDLLYEQSRLKSILERENFSHFSLDLYSREPMEELGGRSNYEHMRKIKNECQSYARNFHRGSQSLLFIGETGVGKSFLTHCIAKEVLDLGFSVLALSAIEFFDLLAHQVFDESGQGYDEQSELLSCDLLIVDDLGTEVTNSFSVSRLFHVVNTRLLDGRPIIISTNYPPSRLRQIYSERTASRILSSYHIYDLYGQDIRILPHINA